MSTEGRISLKYVVPNAVTCTSMVVGLLSILASLDGRFEDAAWLILLSVLLDKLDGTTARLLHASSPFGVQLDSFSDFVTFGLAPAFLFISLATGDPRYAPVFDSPALALVARIIGAFFVVMAALRLAKFNVLTEKIGSKVFLGVPTTLVGGVTSSWVLTAWKYQLPDAVVAYSLFALVPFGLWMVSNIPLPKLGKTGSRSYNLFAIANVGVAYVLVPIRALPEVIFAQGFLYLLIGTLYATLFMRRPELGGSAEAPSPA